MEKYLIGNNSAETVAFMMTFAILMAWWCTALIVPLAMSIVYVVEEKDYRAALLLLL